MSRLTTVTPGLEPLCEIDFGVAIRRGRGDDEAATQNASGTSQHSGSFGGRMSAGGFRFCAETRRMRRSYNLGNPRASRCWQLARTTPGPNTWGILARLTSLQVQFGASMDTSDIPTFLCGRARVAGYSLSSISLAFCSWARRSPETVGYVKWSPFSVR